MKNRLSFTCFSYASLSVVVAVAILSGLHALGPAAFTGAAEEAAATSAPRADASRLPVAPVKPIFNHHFIVITAPPLAASEPFSSHAANTRAFNNSLGLAGAAGSSTYR